MENPSKNIEKTKSTKTIIEAKVTNKIKTIPPVRQTLTSYKRMLKANPLLKYQEAGIDVDHLLGVRFTGTCSKEGTELAVPNSKTSSTLETKASTKEFKKPEAPLKRTQSLKIPKTNRPDVRVRKPLIISGNLPLTNNHFKKTISMSLIGSKSNINTAKSKSENTVKSTSSRFEDRKPIDSKIKSNLLPQNSITLECKSGNNTKKANLKTGNNQKPNHQTLRRSISSDDIRNKEDSKPNLVCKQALQPSESTSHSVENFPPEISPITDDTRENTDFVFKSQLAYERRSISSFTPRSTKKSSLFKASTPASIDTQHLQERLVRMLKSRGKPLSSFQNLRSFDKKNQPKKTTLALVDEENKENIEIEDKKLKSSENCKIITTPESSRVDIQVQNDSLERELPKAAKKAMVELQELIQEDYPGAQCLGWLELIREKYRKADEEPEYWECRAAIEQSIGNVGNAVEFYKTAIIQGAAVSTVDKSLEQLLTKFSLLNISPKKSNQQKVDGDKERIVREARSVFKSTIIQCAVQERKLKK